MKIISSSIKNARTLNGSFYNSKEYLKNVVFMYLKKLGNYFPMIRNLKKPILKPVEFLDPLISEPLFLSKKKILV